MGAGSVPAGLQEPTSCMAVNKPVFETLRGVFTLAPIRTELPGAACACISRLPKEQPSNPIASLLFPPVFQCCLCHPTCPRALPALPGCPRDPAMPLRFAPSHKGSTTCPSPFSSPFWLLVGCIWVLTVQSSFP